MKPKNAPVGEVECPQKGCTETAKVFRFRPRGPADRKTVFSGKHYLECPKHGRIGADGNTTINAYVLEHAKWSPGPAPTAVASKEKPSQSKAPAPSASPNGTASATSEPAPTAGRAWRPLIDLE